MTADAENEPPGPCPPSKAGARAVTVYAPGDVSMLIPAFVADAGESAVQYTLEFFTARIPNVHTRRAYGHAVAAFCAWCQANGVAELRHLTAPTVSAYLSGLRERTTEREALSLPSVKLAASAIRHWLDFLTERGVLPFNPALSVRTPRLMVAEGKTPAFTREQARTLFDVLDAAAATGDILALRDRALFGVLIYSWARISAAVGMLVRDFEDAGDHAALLLHEKGGKERRIACHHKAREYLRAYIAAAGFDPRAKVPLFQSAPRRSGKLSGKVISAGKAWDALKRRCAQAALPSFFCNHSFRAAAITIHYKNGGKLEDAQEQAGHADPRTTRLYIRAARETSQAEIERVQL
jgi:site-specific recombinase XerD